MTIADALKKYNDVEADLLLSYVLKQSKEFLYLHPDKDLTELQRKKFIWLSNQRRHKVPMAYLLGYKYFYDLKFKVNSNVLIPRPETEWLVDESLKIIARKLKSRKTSVNGSVNKKVRVLDVGTGSGAIAISLAASAKPKTVQIFATDISNKSLQMARRNAKTHKAKINFSKHNLLAGVQGKFDIIIANLPYVPITDYKKLLENLKYEPKLALTDSSDHFPLINNFLKQVPKYLNKGGIVLIEADPKFFKKFKHKNWQIQKDNHNLDRFAIIYF